MFKIKLFRFLAILIMGSNFLLIVSENLPSPLNNLLVFAILWFFAILFFYPKILMSRLLIPIYLYASLFGLLALFSWNNYQDSDMQRILKEIVVMFTAVSLLISFIKRNDLKGLSIVIRYGLVFITISAIISFLGLLKYPMAARDLAGVLARDGEIVLVSKYQKMGIGGYSYYASLVFLFPVIIGKLKVDSNNNKTKYFYIFVLVVLYISTIFAQYFANFSLVTFCVIIAIFWRKDNKKTIAVFVISLVFLFVIPQQLILDIIRSTANIFDGMLFQSKINDLVRFLEGGYVGTTEIDARTVRVPVLFDHFVSHPFFGSGIGNAHLHWLNKLATFGILGIVPYFIVLYKQVRFNLKLQLNDYKYYYIISIVSFLFLGSIKSLLGNEILIMVFFILPGLYYLQINKKRPSKPNFKIVKNYKKASL